MTPYTGVCRSFLSVEFATSLLTSLFFGLKFQSNFFIAVYAGRHLSYISSLEKVYVATLQKAIREESTCFLGIEANIEAKQTDFYLDLDQDEIINLPTDSSPLCRFNFLLLIYYLFYFFCHKCHQFLQYSILS